MDARWILLVIAAAGGCMGPSPSACDSATAFSLVERVDGTDILVEDGALVLHAAQSRIHLAKDGDCSPSDIGSVRAGDSVAHDAKQIATSFPAQAWPDNIVVRHGS